MLRDQTLTNWEQKLADTVASLIINHFTRMCNSLREEIRKIKAQADSFFTQLTCIFLQKLHNSIEAFLVATDLKWINSKQEFPNQKPQPLDNRMYLLSAQQFSVLQLGMSRDKGCCNCYQAQSPMDSFLIITSYRNTKLTDFFPQKHQ